MNLEQFLLMKIAEEANELALEAHKAACFGLNSKHPISIQTNLEKMGVEYSDLVAVMELLVKHLKHENQMFPRTFILLPDNDVGLQLKMHKVVKWLQVSAKLERVQIPDPIPSWLAPYWPETT